MNITKLDMSRQMLFVDRFKDLTNALGPGTRSVVWFHGCSRHCKGCLAKEMNASRDCEVISPADLAARVIAVNGVEGLTISGGEPFEQNPEALGTFLSIVRQRSDLSIMAYTGYLLEELREDSQRRELLDFVDVLVDGPYVEEMDEGTLWRGSSNQRIHFLTMRYASLAADMLKGKGRPIEIDFLNGTDFAVTGIPPRGFRNHLRRRLGARGLELKW